MALHEKESIYFDRIVRTEKLHTLMALAYSYYYFDSKDKIQESLEYFLNVFREPPKGSTEGSGTYIGTDKQFTSQYTPALEFGLLKNSRNKELTDLGIKLVKGDISPNQFISNVMLNYFQYINGKPRNLLLELFEYLNNHKIQEFENTDLYNIYSEDKSNRDNINILFDILKETIFFTYDASNKKMKLNNLFNLETLISECNKDMYGDTFKVQDYLGKPNHQIYAEFITQPTFIINNLYSINNYKNKIKVKNRSYDLTEEELGLILKDSFSKAQNKTVSIHLFGIEYGKYITKNKLNIKNILVASELNSSYKVEIYKGIKLSSVAVSYSGDKPIFKNDIDKPHNRIIYGAPGTGKSFKLSEEIKGVFKKNIIKEKNNLELIEDGSNSNYWIVTCGKDNLYWDEFQRKGIFAVGWDQLGDLKQDTTEEMMLKRLKEINSGNYEIKNQWRISHLMKKGDIIGVRKGIKDKQVVGYGIVGGNYKFDESREFFKQTIPVEWKSIEDIKLDKYSKQFPMQSIVEMNNELKIIFKRDYLKEEIQTEIEEIEISTVDRVTFYDGYTHGQFVGTYKPVPEGDSITYKYIPGPFMKQLVESYKNPNHNFCLIIEEINRAKADKVFGNIFQLLDRDSDGKSEYHIAVSADQETYLKKELEEEYGEKLDNLLNEGLYIPNNLYIWATMNSADQGVYPMDSAFKRRWHFEHIGLDENEDQFGEEGKTFGLTYKKQSDAGEMENKIIPWNDFRKIINKNLLGNNVSEDRLLAPFFIKENNFQMKEEESYELDEKVFQNKILMYLFDDVLRHKNKNVLFDENIKSFSQLKSKYNEGKNIFKSDLFSTED